MRNALRQMFGPLLPGLARGASCRIGLQLGHERLNVAQMRQTASGIAFRAVASAGFGCTWDALWAEPRRLKQVVKRVWAGQPFSGKDVVACMPPDQLKIFNVDYTSAEGQSDAEAIARRLETARPTGRAAPCPCRDTGKSRGSAQALPPARTRPPFRQTARSTAWQATSRTRR